MEHSDNPLTVDVPVAGVADPHLVEHLVLGKGLPGTARATFPEQHTRSYLHLRKAHKKWGKKQAKDISVKRGRQNVLLRYMGAASAFFATCVHISLMVD